MRPARASTTVPAGRLTGRSIVLKSSAPGSLTSTVPVTGSAFVSLPGEGGGSGASQQPAGVTVGSGDTVGCGAGGTIVRAVNAAVVGVYSAPKRTPANPGGGATCAHVPATDAAESTGIGVPSNEVTAAGSTASVPFSVAVPDTLSRPAGAITVPPGAWA